MKRSIVWLVVLHGICFLVFLFVPINVAHAYVAVLTVGQGDAVLLHTISGYNILIDAGPDSSVLSSLDRALPPLDRTIDILFLTHPHADHINGALYVLQRYHVGAVVMSPVNYNSPHYALLKKKIREKDILLFDPQATVDWHIDPDIKIDVLFPFTSLAQQTFKNINNASLVMMLEIKGYKVLLTGDMEEKLEVIVAAYYGKQLQAAGLKVGHHGSKTSSSELLLQLVRPQEIFISVGKNNTFHHPDLDTIARLHTWGVVKRTDEVGTITKILL